MLSQTRRTFLKESAAFAVAAGAAQAASPDWKKQIGLEMYTVRDLTDKDYEGTLAKVAEIGYKEIEAATNYANLEPKQFRALLDRLGLTMPSTHVGASAGPDLQKQLEGFQVMGIRYTEIRAASGAGGGGRGPAQTEESWKRWAGPTHPRGKNAG